MPNLTFSGWFPSQFVAHIDCHTILTVKLPLPGTGRLEMPYCKQLCGREAGDKLGDIPVDIAPVFVTANQVAPMPRR